MTLNNSLLLFSDSDDLLILFLLICCISLTDIIMKFYTLNKKSIYEIQIYDNVMCLRETTIILLLVSVLKRGLTTSGSVLLFESLFPIKNALSICRYAFLLYICIHVFTLSNHASSLRCIINDKNSLDKSIDYYPLHKLLHNALWLLVVPSLFCEGLPLHAIPSSSDVVSSLITS